MATWKATTDSGTQQIAASPNHLVTDLSKRHKANFGHEFTVSYNFLSESQTTPDAGETKMIMAKEKVDEISCTRLGRQKIPRPPLVDTENLHPNILESVPFDSLLESRHHRIETSSSNDSISTLDLLQYCDDDTSLLITPTQNDFDTTKGNVRATVLADERKSPLVIDEENTAEILHLNQSLLIQKQLLDDTYSTETVQNIKVGNYENTSELVSGVTFSEQTVDSEDIRPILHQNQLNSPNGIKNNDRSMSFSATDRDETMDGIVTAVDHSSAHTKACRTNDLSHIAIETIAIATDVIKCDDTDSLPDWRKLLGDPSSTAVDVSYAVDSRTTNPFPECFGRRSFARRKLTSPLISVAPRFMESTPEATCSVFKKDAESIRKLTVSLKNARDRQILANERRLSSFPGLTSQTSEFFSTASSTRADAQSCRASGDSTPLSLKEFIGMTKPVFGSENAGNSDQTSESTVRSDRVYKRKYEITSPVVLQKKGRLKDDDRNELFDQDSRLSKDTSWSHNSPDAEYFDIKASPSLKTTPVSISSHLSNYVDFAEGASDSYSARKGLSAWSSAAETPLMHNEHDARAQEPTPDHSRRMTINTLDLLSMLAKNDELISSNKIFEPMCDIPSVSSSRRKTADTYDFRSLFVNQPSLQSRESFLADESTERSYLQSDCTSVTGFDEKITCNNDTLESGSRSFFNCSPESIASVAPSKLATPKSILSSFRWREARMTSSNSAVKKSVAFGSPEYAEYNIGSPSTNLTPLLSKDRLKLQTISEGSCDSMSLDDMHSPDQSCKKGITSVSAVPCQAKLYSKSPSSDKEDTVQVDALFKGSDRLSSERLTTKTCNQDDRTVELESNLLELLNDNGCMVTTPYCEKYYDDVIGESIVTTPETQVNRSNEDAAGVSPDFEQGENDGQQFKTHLATEGSIVSNVNESISANADNEGTTELEPNMTLLLKSFGQEGHFYNDYSTRCPLVQENAAERTEISLRSVESIMSLGAEATVELEGSLTTLLKHVNTQDACKSPSTGSLMGRYDSKMELAKSPSTSSELGDHFDDNIHDWRTNDDFDDSPEILTRERRFSRRISIVPAASCFLPSFDHDVDSSSTSEVGSFHSFRSEGDQTASVPSHTPENQSVETVVLTWKEILLHAKLFDCDDDFLGDSTDILLTEASSATALCSSQLLGGAVRNVIADACEEMERNAADGMTDGEAVVLCINNEDKDNMTCLQRALRDSSGTSSDRVKKLLRTLGELSRNNVTEEFMFWEAKVTEALLDRLVKLLIEADDEFFQVSRCLQLAQDIQSSLPLLSGRSIKRARRKSICRRKTAVAAVNDSIDDYNCNIEQEELALQKIKRQLEAVEALIDVLKVNSSIQEDMQFRHEQAETSLSSLKTTELLYSWTPTELDGDSISVAFSGFRDNAAFVVMISGITDSGYRYVQSQITKDKDVFKGCVVSSNRVYSDSITDCLEKRMMSFLQRLAKTTIDIPFLIHEIGWFYGRLHLIGKEVSNLERRFRGKVRFAVDGVIEVDLLFRHVSQDVRTKLHVRFQLDTCYPFSPLDSVFCDDFDANALERHLVKKSKPGFGYLTRSCDIITAFLQ